MYKEIISKKTTKDITYILWARDLGMYLDETRWEKVRIDGYYLSLSVKLRYFQYRVLSRKLTTNYDRSKWNNKIQKVCIYCKANDMVLHVLYECQKIRKIWTNLTKTYM